MKSEIARTGPQGEVTYKRSVAAVSAGFSPSTCECFSGLADAVYPNRELSPQSNLISIAGYDHSGLPRYSLTRVGANYARAAAS
jgi:hypothetical protein